ncbi:acid phosphatase [Paraburkholderia rhizosphaerae]|uniref:Autotransporter-associated beta strand protein n=1 Tax=Paraburkholderia rhizosphaerae TaxID=480658 RepID=A0A4R8L9I4_9BURK|nr:phosphatase PAP2 family protein [Paraburkholderia rhizosphaerae]TDY38828.1 autotransporter-associated beta strand protein [Paraburkholderia rhizosphaerae]
MRSHNTRLVLLPATVMSSLLLLAACGGSDGNSSTNASTPPAPPPDQQFVDSAPVPDVPAFVDNIATNQRNDARFATLDTNAGVRLVSRFLDLWHPLTEIVDAGVTASAVGSFPAITPSAWTGLPNDGTPGGTMLNPTVLNQNIQFAINETTNRTQAQADAAYFDDRRGKGFSVTDGMGPLTGPWRAAAQQTTTITSIPANATTVLFNDTGNNIGVGSASNATFGKMVDLLSAMGNNASTEPAKRFYKYARPYRWSTSVIVDPTLVPAEATDASTDGGYISGHEAEAMRDAVTMAYCVPERGPEMISRGLELGENRILAGMHSPLDVIAGRMFAYAAAVANLNDPANASLKTAACQQARTALMAATNTTPATFFAFAHSQPVSADRFADFATNKAASNRRMTFGFAQIESTDAPPVVPKGAEVLLENRYPYLSPAQRRVVIKTTEFPSGFPVMDDAEGYGRMDMFAALNGYGQFNGNVTISMDATQGGFSANDTWQNDISGTGKLTLAGSGTLQLAGNNSYSGGSQVTGGTLQAGSATAFGTGDVFIGAGSVAISASSPVKTSGKFTLLPGTTLEMDVNGAGGGQLNVGGQLTFAKSTLHVKFANGFTPKVGDTIPLISGGVGNQQFSTITVDGFKASAVYSSGTVSVHIDS